MARVDKYGFLDISFTKWWVSQSKPEPDNLRTNIKVQKSLQLL
jgi:hypothetical protein